MADLSVADPLALTVGRLRAAPEMLAAFGGADHVSGLGEAPWPHVVVSPGLGGDLRDLLWDVRASVSVEVWDDQAGTRGRAELWRLAMVTLQVLRDWPDQPYVLGTPVVSDVRPSGVLAWAPLPTGQGRWICGVDFTVHPSP